MFNHRFDLQNFFLLPLPCLTFQTEQSLKRQTQPLLDCQKANPTISMPVHLRRFEWIYEFCHILHRKINNYYSVPNHLQVESWQSSMCCADWKIKIWIWRQMSVYDTVTLRRIQSCKANGVDREHCAKTEDNATYLMEIATHFTRSIVIYFAICWIESSLNLLDSHHIIFEIFPFVAKRTTDHESCK